MIVAEQLAPCLLAASPSLRGGFFDRALVLLVEHGEKGALGFVLTRRSRMGFGKVLEQVGIEASPSTEALSPIAVMEGGPVAPGSGWIVFEQRTQLLSEPELIRVGNSLAVSASVDLLRDVAEGRGPARAELMLGYSGWGPQQLEQEVREGSWIPLDLDGGLFFEVPAKERWRAALSRDGIDPAFLSGGPAATA